MFESELKDIANLKYCSQFSNSTTFQFSLGKIKIKYPNKANWSGTLITKSILRIHPDLVQASYVTSFVDLTSNITGKRAYEFNEKPNKGNPTPETHQDNKI